MYRKSGLFVAVTAAFVISGAAQAADVVVLDSSTSSVAAGDVVSADLQVTIPGGASVTVILPNGETKIIQGPYAGAIGSADEVESAGLEALTATRGGETKVLGAVRAPNWEITN